MNTLQIKLPEEVTDKSLPKLGEIAVKVASNKAFTIVNTNVNSGVRSEGCLISRTYPTPVTTPSNNVAYVGTSEAVTTSNTGSSSYVFLGSKGTITTLLRSSATSSADTFDFVHGDLKSSPISNLDMTWVTYRGGMYPIDKLNWDSLRTLSVASDNDHGTPRTITGDFGDVDLSKIATMKLGNQQIYGNLDEDFLKATSLTELSLANNQLLIGNVSGLKKCTSLTKLTLNTCKNISGTLESLLDGMVAQGKTSGSIVIGLIQSAITYNGSVPVANITATFTSSGWSVA